MFGWNDIIWAELMLGYFFGFVDDILGLVLYKLILK